MPSPPLRAALLLAAVAWPAAAWPAVAGTINGPMLFPASVVLTGAIGKAAADPAASHAAAAWASVRGSTAPGVFEAFVAAFPTSPFAAEAEARAEALRRAAETVMPGS